jgi:hypothetical protein
MESRTFVLVDAEDRRRALWPQEGIGNIAGNLDRHVFEPFVRSACIKRGDPRQGLAALPDRLPLVVEDPEPKGREKPDAAFARGAPPDADDEFPGPGIKGCGDKLPGTVGAGLHGVEPLPAQQLYARSACHVQHRHLAATDKAELRVYLVPQRAGNADLDETASRSLGHGPGRAFSAICQGNLEHLGGLIRSEDALLDDRAGLRRTHVSFE